jgi:hypothetical protein
VENYRVISGPGPDVRELVPFFDRLLLTLLRPLAACSSEPFLRGKALTRTMKLKKRIGSSIFTTPFFWNYSLSLSL